MDLLVQARIEVAGPLTVRLTTTDEDRSAAIAVTCRTAALLATELLAGAGNVGARIEAEDLVVELEIPALASRASVVEGLNCDLHRLAFLAFVG